MCDDFEDIPLEEADFWAMAGLQMFGMVLMDLILHPEGAKKIMNGISHVDA